MIECLTCTNNQRNICSALLKVASTTLGSYRSSLRKPNTWNATLFITEFQEAFNLFDNRGDGKIQQQQIGECLRALGQNPTESDVKKFTHQLKPDERISFEVFLPIYQVRFLQDLAQLVDKKYKFFKAISKQRSGDTADDFIEGLRHFDKDASGFISSAELRHLLTTLGEKLSDEEVEQLMNNQEDSQGNVNYEEFVRMVMNG